MGLFVRTAVPAIPAPESALADGRRPANDDLKEDLSPGFRRGLDVRELPNDGFSGGFASPLLA